MKKVFFLFGLFFFLVFGAVFAQNYLKTNNILLPNKTPKAVLGDHTFVLNVADSQEEKEIGLSETESLPENQGMIFLFEKLDYHSFWMKNMKIPIDIIYINNDEIVSIQSNVEPPTDPTQALTIYKPTDPSDKVLEINAGLSEKYNFKKGDKVKYENLGD